MRQRACTYTMIVLLGLAWVSARADDGVSVATSVAVDSVTVGERFRIQHRFTYSDSLAMAVVDRFDPGTCRVLAAVWSDDDQGDVKHRTLDITAITLDLESASLPGIDVPFVSVAGDTVWAFTDDVKIPVRQQINSESTMRAIKEQWEAPRSWWGWIVGGVATLIAAALVWWWFRRRQRRGVSVEPEPILPADYVALTELTRIERLALLDEQEYKKYYSLVTDAVRRYLGRRFGVDAIDRTTTEVVWDLQARQISVAKLEALLGEADLVKFAKYMPTMDDGAEAMRTAREIVVTTTPRVDPTEDNDDAEARVVGGTG